MENSKQLQSAVMRQFHWVKVVFSDGSVHTTREKLQAYLFGVMHVCFFLTLCGHSLWPMVSVILTFLLQTGACAIAMILYATFEEYADTMRNAMDLEQSQNPLMVASISVRLFSLFHALLTRSTFLFLFGLVEIAYDVKEYYKNNLLIDATTVWKHTQRLRVDRSIRLGYNCCMILVAIGNMLYLFLRDN